MKFHSALGSQIISMISGHEAGSEIIATNHDHYNDTGDPNGLSGNNIPLASGILDVDDSYASLIEKRV